MDYKIVTDGSCDLPPELCRERELTWFPSMSRSTAKII